MKNIFAFADKKHSATKISMVTCYDYASAKIINQSDVDCILVGDSVAMVMHGFDSTVHATVEMMAFHIAAVARGARDKFIVGDMPFLSYRKSLSEAMDAVDKIMKAGAHAVKLEGVHGHETIVEHIVKSGVPVMGHIGLTPQSIHQMGGFHVQGKSEKEAQNLLLEAQKLESLGCFSLVLECVPASLSKRITDSLKIPTIGIGAGVDTDGQVLVLQDLLGMDRSFRPKFLKYFMDGEILIKNALNQYHLEVVTSSFPTKKESY